MNGYGRTNRRLSVAVGEHAPAEHASAERRSGIDRRKHADPSFDPRFDRRSGSDRRSRSGSGGTRKQFDTTLERFVFDQLPYPLVVLSRTGVLLTANQAARDLLPLRVQQPGIRCCDLLGCHHAPGVLAEACFTDLVAEAGLQLPPIRSEPPGNHRGDGSFITAVPLAQDPSRIVVQLANGEPRVRSFATTTRPNSQATLRISTLGRTHLENDDGLVDGAWLEQRPGDVLQYLVCERHRWVLTDEIAEAIWPNPGPSSVENVRFVIYELRRRLEPGRPHRGRSAFILSGRGRYRLDTNNVAVDADEFQKAVDEGTAAFADGSPTTAAKSLDHALELYKGDFLPDAPYATWVVLERSRLLGLATKALRLRAELARNAGDVNGLMSCFERLARVDPFDMDVHREWLAMCLELGRFGEASRHYGDLQRRMVREFGQRPSFELRDLVR